MLERLTIENFQKHKKLVIDFDESITTIVGRSDLGKSACIRAIRWVCTNKPSGDGFIKHGSESSTVKLRVDGHTITRKKGKGANSYTLDKQEYHALGQGGVPEDIADLLNVSPNLNFQNQMDAPFWFMLSPGEVSRQINQIVNLDLIDKALGNVASELRRTRTQVQMAEERVEETRKRVNELAWAEEADKELQQLEILYKCLHNCNVRIALSREIIAEVEKLEAQRESLAEAKESGLELLEVADRLRHSEDRLEKLKECVSDIQETEAQLDITRKELTRLNEDMEKQLDGKCPLCKQPIEEEQL